MAKYSPISGFPEWTPGQRRLEQQIMHSLRHVFECSGFAPLETRSVEPLSVLLSKGDDKEIYVLKRLHDDESAPKSAEKEQLGLHFDLTVPFARYVVEHQHLLQFPFKRYQMQKSWRGERPQEGRFREFYQCDIDLIGSGKLDVAADAEMAITLGNALKALPVPPIDLSINNRKVLQGFYKGLGIIEDQMVADTLRIVDKIAKIGPDGVAGQLQESLGISDNAIEKILSLATINSARMLGDTTFEKAKAALNQAQGLDVTHDLFLEGLAELEQVLQLTQGIVDIHVDLSIARGLDYYTATVYEGTLRGHEHIGAVCAGGRYDNLIAGGKTAYPGVGVSIGLTRILGYLFGRDLIEVQAQSPTQVMIILNDEDSRSKAFQVAHKLRERHIAVEVYHTTHNFGKQLKAIQKRNIPYVLFIEKSDSASVPTAYAIKTMATGEQVTIDIDQWLPAESYDQVSFKTHF